MYGARKSSRLYLKVRQAWWSHKGKQCHSRVSISVPASRASLTFKRLQSSQHSETRGSNAPLITLLSGSFVMDTSSQPNLRPFRFVPSASGSVGIHYLCSSVLKIKLGTWALNSRLWYFRGPSYWARWWFLTWKLLNNNNTVRWRQPQSLTRDIGDASNMRYREVNSLCITN